MFDPAPRDHYLRLDSNDYSVHPTAIGRRVELVADLHQVEVFCHGRLVAAHQRAWAKHQTMTDPAHRKAADQLRRDRLTVLSAPGEVQVERRRLSDYDLPSALPMVGPVRRRHDPDRGHRPQRQGRGG